MQKIEKNKMKWKDVVQSVDQSLETILQSMLSSHWVGLKWAESPFESILRALSKSILDDG